MVERWRQEMSVSVKTYVCAGKESKWQGPRMEVKQREDL